MNWRVKKLNHDNAVRDDIRESSRWYNRKQRGLGLEFRTELRIAFRAVTRNPETFPFVESNVRRYVVRRFPFLVYYTVCQNEVRILRVIHTSRDPETWKNNLKK